MNWQNDLIEYEHQKDWKSAIELLQKIINDNPNDLDSYLSMNYILMNLLVEEDYNKSEHNFYAALLKKYFLESYSKFSNNPEYLFFTGIMAHMSEWYFEITIEEAKIMIKEAFNIDKKNLLYKWGYYTYLDVSNEDNKKLSIACAKEILIENSSIKKMLELKGSLGKYVLELIAYSSRNNNNEM